MKKNGYDQITSPYYIGLDVGTDSVGYAVTDKEYNLKRFHGKNMWGIRLFSAGETAAARRQNRTNRRRLKRRNWRLDLLHTIFDQEISKIDPGFFFRLEESSLHLDDKKGGSKYSIFADADYTDIHYLKTYPTIYHLRRELIRNVEPHDPRLVYLAIRHIVKNRGHFLFDIGTDTEDGVGFDELLEALIEQFKDACGIELTVPDQSAVHNILIDKEIGKSEKAKRLWTLVHYDAGERDGKQSKTAVNKLLAFISGSKINSADLFGNEAYKELPSFSADMNEEVLEKLSDGLGQDFDLIAAGVDLYNCILLEKVTKGYAYVSDYKIAQYQQHKDDIRTLREYVKAVLCDRDLYKEIFEQQKTETMNYAAYSGYKKGNRMNNCSQSEFCNFLKKKLPTEVMGNDVKYIEMYKHIAEETFAPKLRSSENGVVPNSLHKKELVKILENASSYLPFLKDVDPDGISTIDKIVSVFSFKLPYYVGPLKSGWAVRNTQEKVYPWNLERVINFQESASAFIERMTSICTYTGEAVLPKDSLLFAKYTVLNEINNLKVNGNSIPVPVKQSIYENLFVQKNQKVTLKKIRNYLKGEGLIEDMDIVSGVNDTLTSSLTSYHKMKRIIDQTSDTLVEEIIRRVVLFRDDKKLLRTWLKGNTPLCDADIQYVLKLKFKDWGGLSHQLLAGITDVDKSTGEIVTIMDMLWETNLNLMQLLSGDFEFKAKADAHKKEKYQVENNPRKAVDALYVSPAIRRSIWQTMRIVDEIVDIEQGAPEKIFIEVARDKEGKNEKKATASRKNKLLELYRSCKMEQDELFPRLQNEEEGRLRSDKLYLYYTQFGRCMYCGKPIDFESLMDRNVYDIDHIFPRSKIKDDSLDNRVLVHAEENRAKTDIYPLAGNVRSQMVGFWKNLLDKEMISPKKYERLVRNSPLTEDELASFVNRQLVETRQSTKALAELFKTIYPAAKVVYSKAGNVSEFRQEFEIKKCRAVNDHHHTHDAYLNIVVGNYYDTRFTAKFFRDIYTERYSLRPETMYKKFNVDGAWVSGEEGTIATVRKMLGKNNVLYTRQAFEEHGQLYDLMLLKAPNGQVEIKQGRDIQKYGGYNKATGAYFALIEYPEKKKIVRSLEAVLLYQKQAYEADPEGFARAHWNPEAKVIVPKILMNSLLEFDGARYHITGRTGNQIVLNQAHQLIVSPEKLNYLKQLEKYVERSKKAQKELPVSERDGVSAADNASLYQLFVAKIEQTIYGKMFSSMLADMKLHQQKFLEMSLLEQSKLLLEILKAFKCNAEHPSFKELCGKGTVGITLKNKKISGNETVYLIHQSASGLFEIKQDLLQ